MNEQYLFRGKRIDNETWESCGLDTDWGLAPERRWRYWIIPPYIDPVPVIPETIGQCTGTPDKNGKFVFGGDIVKAYRHNEIPYTEVVTFRDGCFWFGSWNWVEFLNVFRNIEVIGNIHDNEDLLLGLGG